MNRTCFVGLIFEGKIDEIYFKEKNNPNCLKYII